MQRCGIINASSAVAALCPAARRRAGVHSQGAVERKRSRRVAGMLERFLNYRRGTQEDGGAVTTAVGWLTCSLKYARHTAAPPPSYQPSVCRPAALEQDASAPKLVLVQLARLEAGRWRCAAQATGATRTHRHPCLARAAGCGTHYRGAVGINAGDSRWQMASTAPQ